MSDQLFSEMYDLFRITSVHPKWISGVNSQGHPFWRTLPVFITNQLITFLELSAEGVGRKKSREFVTHQYLAATIDKYMAIAFGLYNDDTLDLLPYALLHTGHMERYSNPRTIGQWHVLCELIDNDRKYTINPHGVVIDCYNAGEVDQIILVEQDGYILFKVHYSNPGVLIDNKGIMVDSSTGADFCGYFTPTLLPQSYFLQCSDEVAFEFDLYSFILECYADIVCGSESVNRRFRKRDVINKGIVEMTEESESDSHKLGIRFIPRNIHRKIQTGTQNKAEYDLELKKYFVTGHIRKLPNGHSASREAISHASEYGIDLPQGFTFVKPYESGEEKVRTHYIKRVEES
ncbi:hypothetical protein [Paenibacillus piri]|uniref:Uncharacterized protein n=1 Tax=Paenibacillus piri TaxID=2547395 RepID=A0A4R5KL85_9BACL|nr:hypothetical protein [Paenibacillus piri]TDF95210.1 hypothetical protein E1757_22090 [Paenibacillus piri]